MGPRPPSSWAAWSSGSPSAGSSTRREEETSPGSLYASGLIAAGGIVGLFAVAVKALETTGRVPANLLHVGGPLEANQVAGVIAFVLLAYSLYYFAKKPLKS